MDLLNYSIRILHLCILLWSGLTECAKILSIPFPLYSHVQTMTWLHSDLQSYGHDLWTAVPSVMTSQGVIKNKSLNFITYDSLDNRNPEEYWLKPVVSYYLEPDSFQSVIEGSTFSKLLDRIMRYVDPSVIPNEAFIGAAFINDLMLRDGNFTERIRKHKFDYIIVDSTIGMPLAVIPYKLDIPFCFIGPFYDSWRAGTPTFPSFSPVVGMGTNDRMNFKERLISTLQHILLMAANPLFSESILSEYVPEKPYMSMTTLSGKANLWLIEQSEVIDYPRSAMPNTKFLGGLSVADAKPLQGKFANFYDKAKQIVLVSFGSHIKSLPRHLFEKLYKAFSNTPYQYVWRTDGPVNDTNKFLVSEWIPQNDILGHPKTKLFITHCGAYSQFEALYNEVPMIGLPVYAEQHYNSRRMAVKQYGLAMDFHTSTVEDLTTAIKQVIETPIYKKKITKASKIFKDKPLTPRQEAAFWLDHVIKYGDGHFRSGGLDLAWYQFLCLDVISLLLLVFFLFLFLSYTCICCLTRRIFKSSKQKAD